MEFNNQYFLTNTLQKRNRIQLSVHFTMTTVRIQSIDASTTHSNLDKCYVT